MSKHGDIFEGLKVARIMESTRDAKKIEDLNAEGDKVTKDWLDQLKIFLGQNGFNTKNWNEKAMFTLDCWKDKKRQIVVTGGNGSKDYRYNTMVIYGVYLGEDQKRRAVNTYDSVGRLSQDFIFMNDAQLDDYKNKIKDAMQDIEAFVEKLKYDKVAQ